MRSSDVVSQWRKCTYVGVLTSILFGTAWASPSKPIAKARPSRVTKITGKVMWLHAAKKGSVKAENLRTEKWLHAGDRVQTTSVSTAQIDRGDAKVQLTPQSLFTNGTAWGLNYGVFLIEVGKSGATFVLGKYSKWVLRVQSAKVLVAAVESAQRFNELQTGEAADIPDGAPSLFIQVAVRSGEAMIGDHRLFEGDSYQIHAGVGDHFPTHPGADPIRALVRAFHF